MKKPIVAVAAALLASQAAPAKSMDRAMDKAMESISTTTTYHRASVDGVSIFYREAGPKDAPTLLLLHGFPTSSQMFRGLIPALADRYHVVEIGRAHV